MAPQIRWDLLMINGSLTSPDATSCRCNIWLYLSLCPNPLRSPMSNFVGVIAVHHISFIRHCVWATCFGHGIMDMGSLMFRLWLWSHIWFTIHYLIILDCFLCMRHLLIWSTVIWWVCNVISIPYIPSIPGLISVRVMRFPTPCRCLCLKVRGKENFIPRVPGRLNIPMVCQNICDMWSVLWPAQFWPYLEAKGCRT
jgi:hypothetical protein